MLQCSGCNLILKIYIIQQSGFQPAADKSALMDELPIWQIDLQLVYNNKTKWQCSYSAY